MVLAVAATRAAILSPPGVSPRLTCKSALTVRAVALRGFRLRALCWRPSFSARLPGLLCQRIASGAAAANGQLPGLFPLAASWTAAASLGVLEPLDFAAAFPEGPGFAPFFEDPDWVVELATALPFRELLRYRFKKSGHINVLESRTYKTWVKHLASASPNCRAVGLLDSRVTLGASAKGRSSSEAISRVLQGTLPYILGGGLYPGGLHVPSEHNPETIRLGDAAFPAPLVSFLRGCSTSSGARLGASMYVMVASSRFSRPLGRWLRLLLLLAGDVEQNPGPPRLPPTPRGPLDLRSGFTSATAQRMRKCFAAFESWLFDEAGLPFSGVVACGHHLALALRAYGLHLFAIGLPRYLLVYAITAAQDRYPQPRGSLGPAWQIDHKCQAVEPGECRPVISLPIVQSMTALALAWNWPSFVAVSCACSILPNSSTCGEPTSSFPVTPWLATVLPTFI